MGGGVLQSRRSFVVLSAVLRDDNSFVRHSFARVHFKSVLKRYRYENSNNKTAQGGRGDIEKDSKKQMIFALSKSKERAIIYF